jgi:hypothetical protein
MKDSNKLIEDFMLLANRRVAEKIGAIPAGKPENQNKAQKKKKYVLLFTEFTMIPTLKNCSNFLNLWQDLVIN